MPVRKVLNNYSFEFYLSTASIPEIPFWLSCLSILLSFRKNDLSINKNKIRG